MVAAARRRHATALRSYVAELLRGDRTRVEAVLEETWAALAKLPEAEAEPRLGEWLFAQARRHALTGSRAAIDANERSGDDDGSPEAIFDRLTPKQQEVLHLRLGPEFRHEQIAAIVELSPAHVAQLLHVALGRLAPAFREGGAPDARVGRGDDARLTLAALGELEGENRRTWEAGLVDARATLARLEEVRRAVKWSGDHLSSGRRQKRGAKAPRGTRRIWWVAAVVVMLAAMVGAAWWFSQERRGAELDRAAAVAPVPTSGLRDVAVRRGNGGIAADPRAESRVEPTARAREVAPASSRHFETSAAGEDAGSTNLGAAEGAPERKGDGHRPPLQEEVEAPRDEVVVVRSGHGTVGGPSSGEAANGVPRAIPAASRELGPPEMGPVAPASSRQIETSGAGRDAGATDAGGAALAPVASTDTAAIVALKRALGRGRWPRPEEVDRAKLQAYFTARARTASRAMLFEKSFEAAPAPWAPDRLLVRAVAQAPDAPPSNRPRANVILLLDVSGSMEAPNRLPLVQEAVRGLIDRLRPDDRVGLVTYAGEASVLLAPAELTDPARVRTAVMALEARGRTNGGAGLAEAFALTRSDGPAQHLVLLCTDGEFNMGASSEDELAALVQAARSGDANQIETDGGHRPPLQEDGVRLAIFGFGRAGQIDPRLEKLAALGGGGSGYVNTRADAVRVLLGQLDELVAPVARDVWLAVEADAAGAVRPAALARAEALLPGDTIATLSEAPHGEAAARARLDYVLARNGEARTETWGGPIAPVEFAAASAEFRFAAAVARFAELLRGPREEAAREWDALEAWAREAVDDAGGYRAEFLALVAQARAAR